MFISLCTLLILLVLLAIWVWGIGNPSIEFSLHIVCKGLLFLVLVTRFLVECDDKVSDCLRCCGGIERGLDM